MLIVLMILIALPLTPTQANENRQGGFTLVRELGSEGDFLAAAISPDGTRLAIAATRRVSVYDLTQNPPALLPDTLEETAHIIAWSPDGTQLAMARTDELANTADEYRIQLTAWVWGMDGQTTDTLFSTEGFRGAEIGWSPDGGVIVVTSDEQAWVFDAATRALRFEGVNAGGIIPRWTPDGNLLLGRNLIDRETGSGKTYFDGTFYDNQIAWTDEGLITYRTGAPVQVWDTATGTLIRETAAIGNRVNQWDGNPDTAAALSPDGRYVAMAQVDTPTLNLYATQTGEIVRTFEMITPMKSLRWYGEQIVVFFAGRIELWTDAGEKLAAIAGEIPDNLLFRVQQPILGGEWLLVPSGYGMTTLTLFNLKERTQFDDFPVYYVGNYNLTWAIRDFYDRTEVALLTSWRWGTGVVYMWDTTSWELLSADGVAAEAGGSSISSPSDSALSLYYDSFGGGMTLYRYDEDTGTSQEQGVEYPMAERIIQDVAWSQDGKRIVTGDNGGTVIVWAVDADAVTMEPLVSFKAADTPLHTVMLSPDGESLFIGQGDGMISVWGMDGEANTTFNAHRGAVYDLVWSPDGIQFASIGADGVIRIWQPSP